MKLSKRTEYGLRALVHLAGLDPRQYVQSRDLAKHEGLPLKFLESILLVLRRADLLDSKVGSGGGYRLSRPANQITVGDLISRLDGHLGDREDSRPPDASPGQHAVQLINKKLTDATDQVLASLTLDQLRDHASRMTKPPSTMYYI